MIFRRDKNPSVAQMVLTLKRIIKISGLKTETKIHKKKTIHCRIIKMIDKTFLISDYQPFYSKKKKMTFSNMALMFIQPALSLSCLLKNIQLQYSLSIYIFDFSELYNTINHDQLMTSSLCHQKSRC